MKAAEARSADDRVSMTRVLKRRLIDTDVHPYPRYPGELREYLSEPWCSRNLGPLSRGVYKPPGGGRRSENIPSDGSPAGSDPDLLWDQVFARPDVNVDYVILLELLGGVLPNPDFNAAYRSAINSWLDDTWLTKYNSHGRYKGSISVPANNPSAAVAEIEKWAGHPHFVQVQVPGWGVDEPYGHPQFNPIWQAAARHNLPVAVHANDPGGIGSWITPVGFVRYWMEHHATMYPLSYIAQIVSLICDGTFDRYPDLRFVFVEGGSQWFGPLVDEIVAANRYLAEELNLRTPITAEFITDHIRLTTQPMEEAPSKNLLLRSFDTYAYADVLMYASDYPHWDADDPVRAFPSLPDAIAESIYCANAAALYNLPAGTGNEQ